jgi:DNA-binding SARP family transcriptional activator
MYTVFVYLFGQFRFQFKGCEPYTFKPGKSQELLAYLLLKHPRVHSREALASMFWDNVPTIQALKNLRQTLWQVRSILDTTTSSELLLVDAERISINRDAVFWFDVAFFRQIAEQVEGISGESLTAEQIALLECAIKLYTADLLEGWYHDWCIYERECLQRTFIILLDKMISYCQKHQQYEKGVQYGEHILRYDQAHERTHRCLMYLHYIAGDRTTALRQYERCRQALQGELGVEPAITTVMLYEQIRADQLQARAIGESRRPLSETLDEDVSYALADVLKRLHQIHEIISQGNRIKSNEKF